MSSLKCMSVEVINSLKCKYGFSRSKPWKEGKSWIISGLKLKWDASGGKTMHEGALVLMGFMWSLSVRSQSLNVSDQTLMHV